MTAINLWIPADGTFGLLLTDSAGTKTGTRIYAQGVAKALALPHMGCAVAFRAEMNAAYWLAQAVQRFESFDALLNGVPALAEPYGNFKLVCNTTAAEMTVCGWSASASRVRGFQVRSDSGFVPQVPPIGKDALFVGPGLSPAQYEEAGIMHNREPHLAAPSADLLRLMKMQRATCPEGIGGKVIETMIERGGAISQIVIHTWAEDKIGQPIDPRATVAPQRQHLSMRDLAAMSAGGKLAHLATAL